VQFSLPLMSSQGKGLGLDEKPRREGLFGSSRAACRPGS
jgi:hypothetical protein